MSSYKNIPKRPKKICKSLYNKLLILDKKLKTIKEGKHKGLKR